MSGAGVTEMGSLTALGLSEDPFAADALFGFYFVGGQRRFLLQQAVHGLYIARSIVLVSGERGAGKSHLLAALQGELEGLADCCAIAASVLMDGRAIRSELAELYRLPPDSADDNESLVAELSRQTPADTEPLPVALLIDDAQELAVQVLAELQQLVELARGRVRLLLAGEPTLVTAWQQLPVATAELLELQPLDLQESADYLQTRLQAAGWRGALPLTSEQMLKLYRASGGCIGKLNELAPAALAAGGDGDTMTPSAGSRPLPWRWIGVAAAVLLVIGVALLWFVDTPSTPSQSMVVEAGGRTAVALPLPVAPPDTTVSEPPPASIEPEQSRRVAVPAPLPNAPVAAPQAAVKPIPVPAPMPARQPASPAPATKPVPAVVLAPKSVAVARVASTPAKVVEKPKVAAPVAVAKPQSPVPSGSAVAYRFDEQKLQGVAPERYVLQLMAVESRAQVDAFLKAHAVTAPTLLYEALRGGKRLLVLVAGPYADRAAAQAALAKLPPPLLAAKPWPRTVASVQSDIRAAHGGR